VARNVVVNQVSRIRNSFQPVRTPTEGVSAIIAAPTNSSPNPFLHGVPSLPFPVTVMKSFWAGPASRGTRVVVGTWATLQIDFQIRNRGFSTW